MPRYFPIEVTPNIRASQSNMLAIHWQSHGGNGRGNLMADFRIPGSERDVLRVHFDQVEFVRVLDEFPLSTEETDVSVGLISEHFAYVVEGALFWSTQSSAWLMQLPKAKHYRFITGWACLDVIANAEPKIDVVPLLHTSNFVRTTI